MELLAQRELGIGRKEGFLRQMHFTEAQARSLQVERVLDAHQGCVNRMAWNQEGTRLASGSDDRKVMIWSAPGPAMPPLSVSTHHRANIFGVQFLPCTGDAKIVTAAMDHTVQLHELSRAEVSFESEGFHSRGGRSVSPTRPVVAQQRSSQVFYCHTNRVKDVKVEPMNPHNFWSAGEDGMVRQFDTRCSSQTTHDAANVLVYASSAGGPVELKALDINKAQPHLLAVGCGDPYVRIYDRRMLGVSRPPTRGSSGTAPLLKLAPTHLTCSGGGLHRTHSTYVQFSWRGDKLVATYHGDHAYTFDLLGAMTNTLKRPSPVKTCASAPASPAHEAASSSASRTGGKPSDSSPLSDTAEAARRKGNRAMFEEDWSTAVLHLTEALELAPGCASLYARRAEALLARNWPGDALWALQDCEEAIQLDPRGCPLAYFRRVRALQSLKQLQCARLALDQYKALFPERCSAEDVAAISAALERQLRQRQRQREQWQMQRKHEKRILEGTLRSINEGRHTPRPRRSPPAPPYPQASPPGPAPEAESEPFIGPPRPPRDAWGEAVPSISTAAHAVTSMPNGTDSQRSAAEPTGTALSSVSIPAQGFSVAHSGSPAASATGQPLRLEGQVANASAMVAEGAEIAQGGAAAAADRAATDQPQAMHAAPSSSTAALAAQPPGHIGPGSSTPTRPAAGLVLDCSSDSDSDSDSELGAEEDDSDHPDNPCRETLLAFYTHICAVERGNRSGRAPDSQPGSANKATSVGELQAALHSNVAQRFIGQCNLQTDIKEAVFLGQGDRLVACGSDDGRVYIYCAETGLLLRALEADEDVANCCQPHPHCTLLATSGIENVIRLWSPGPEPSTQEVEALRELVASNQSRNREGPAVLRGSHLRALADSPHLYSLLMSQLYGRHADGSQEDEDDDADPRAEVSCRVN